MAQASNAFLWETHVGSLVRVALDTNALIYLLDGVQPHASRVQTIMERAQHGLVTVVLSAIVELELLVKPVREQDRATVARIEMVLHESPGISLIPVDHAAAVRAAQVRARTRLPTPDAIIAATALELGCNAIIGNDYVMAARFQDIPYLVLNDYA